jgi:hypothetical protein
MWMEIVVSFEWCAEIARKCRFIFIHTNANGGWVNNCYSAFGMDLNEDGMDFIHNKKKCQGQTIHEQHTS